MDRQENYQKADERLEKQQVDCQNQLKKIEQAEEELYELSAEWNQTQRRLEANASPAFRHALQQNEEGFVETKRRLEYEREEQREELYRQQRRIAQEREDQERAYLNKLREKEGK